MQTTVARELEWGTKGSEILPWAEGRGGSTAHGPPRTFLLESTRPPRLSHRAMSSGQCPGARKIARQNAAVRCKKCPAYWPACGTAVACSQDTIKEFRCLRPHITIRDQVLFPAVHMSFPGTFETNGVPREGPLVVPGRPADIVEGPPFITGNWRRRASANFFKPGRPPQFRALCTLVWSGRISRTH
jgi:hypothetical protein